MRHCPGAASPEPLIWCAQSAAAGWYDFKRNVYAALKADALLTFDEIRAGIDAAGISGRRVVRAVRCGSCGGVRIGALPPPNRACYRRRDETVAPAPSAQAALAKASGLYLAFALRTTRPPLTPLQARQAQAASLISPPRLK